MIKVRLFFVLLLGVFLMFGGCSKLGGSGSLASSDGPDVDNTGNGLVVGLDVDTKNILNRRLKFTISLENTGKQAVVISGEDFSFGTQEGHDSGSWFDGDMKTKLFSADNLVDGSVKLAQNQKLVTVGVVQIKEGEGVDSLHTLTNGLNAIMDIGYDYKTDFYANVELKEEYGLFEINRISGLSQASPVQVVDIYLEPEVADTEYSLFLKIRDVGDRGNVKSVIDESFLLDNFKLTFDTRDVSGCKVQKDSVNKVVGDEIRLKKGKELTLKCPIVIDKKDAFTTQLVGSFDFRYDVQEKVHISIPKDMKSSD